MSTYQEETEKLEGDLFVGGEEIEAYEFDEAPQIDFVERAQDQAPEVGATGKETGLMFVALYDSILSRLAGMYSGADRKQFALDQEEKKELQNAAGIYFEASKTNIPPWLMFFFSLIVITASVAARARKMRKENDAAAEKIAAAEAQRRQVAAEEKRQKQAANEFLDNLPVKSAATSTVRTMPDVYFERSKILIGATDQTPDAGRKRFEVCKQGFYSYGTKGTDENGSEYRDKDNPGTWIKAPEVILQYVRRQPVGTKKKDINAQILDLGLWKQQTSA